MYIFFALELQKDVTNTHFGFLFHKVQKVPLDWVELKELDFLFYSSIYFYWQFPSLLIPSEFYLLSYSKCFYS